MKLELSQYIQSDGSLKPSSWDQAEVVWRKSARGRFAPTIFLLGSFTQQDLSAILAYMMNPQYEQARYANAQDEGV